MSEKIEEGNKWVLKKFDNKKEEFSIKIHFYFPI